jgi:hypothetical protein
MNDPEPRVGQPDDAMRLRSAFTKTRWGRGRFKFSARSACAAPIAGSDRHV